jgi:hypothetical protein
MGWERREACMGNKKIVKRFSGGLEGTRQFRRAKRRCKGQDNIKIGLKIECNDVDWIHLGHDRVR